MIGSPGQAKGTVIRAVILGPPGSGKGTQAELLCRRFGCHRISTGDLLREAVRDMTRLGKQVQSILDAGRLVSDDLVGEVVEEKLRSPATARGYLLDGFPRTLRQVEILDGILERTGGMLDVAVLLEVEEAEILRRLGGRRVCSGCGATFHVEFQPPRSADSCDECGGKLKVRKDDQEDVIRERLRLYRKETTPVVDCYRKRGILKTVRSGGSAAEVSERFLTELAGMVA